MTTGLVQFACGDGFRVAAIPESGQVLLRMDAQTALELCETIWQWGRDRDAFVDDFPIELAAAVGNAAEHAGAGSLRRGAEVAHP